MWFRTHSGSLIEIVRNDYHYDSDYYNDILYHVYKKKLPGPDLITHIENLIGV